MRKLLESTKYIALIGVLSTLVTSVIVYLWSLWKLYLVISALVQGKDAKLTAQIIELIDIVLIATTIYIICLGLYELFVGDLTLPKWLTITDFTQLKSKVASLVILVLSVTFLKQVVDWDGSQGLVYLGVAVAAVGAMLIWFTRGDENHGAHS